MVCRALSYICTNSLKAQTFPLCTILGHRSKIVKSVKQFFDEPKHARGGIIKAAFILMNLFTIRARKEKSKRFSTKLPMNRTGRTDIIKMPLVFDTHSPLIERGQGKDT